MSLGKTKRLLALDVFRGMTIAFMIIVNTPGSWSHVYSPLLHASWHGLTPTDLVFPFFLFIVGISMSFSLKKYNSKKGALIKIVRRTAVIFLIGLFLNWFPFYDTNFADLRIFGVLQRIALAYGIGAILCINLDDRVLLPASLIILFFYAVILQFTGTGDVYSLQTNGVRAFDIKILGESHLYQGFGIAFDPEGILSTLGGVGNVMIGYFLGRKLNTSKKISWKLQQLSLYGLVLILSGLVLNWMGTPINKPLWTPSYSVLTSGIGALLLTGLIWAIDVKSLRSRSKFFEIFGLNALVSYALSSLIIQIISLVKIDGSTLYGLYYSNFLQPLLGNKLGSLTAAISYMLLIWLIAFFMYRKRWFVKI